MSLTLYNISYITYITYTCRMIRDGHHRKTKFSMVVEYSNFMAGIGASIVTKNKYLEIFWKFRIRTDVLKVFNLWPQLWRHPQSPSPEIFEYKMQNLFLNNILKKNWGSVKAQKCQSRLPGFVPYFYLKFASQLSHNESSWRHHLYQSKENSIFFD